MNTLFKFQPSFAFLLKVALTALFGLLLTLQLLSNKSQKASAQATIAAPPTKPLVIAHRGASGYLPEHTLEAKALAYGQGADYVEQDVVLTKDNHLVVLHDVHLDTVTDVAQRFPKRKRDDGRYYALDFTLDEIRSLNAIERRKKGSEEAAFEDRFPYKGSGFSVPSLHEEIEMVLGLNSTLRRNVGLYIEVKAPAWHREQGRDIWKVLVQTLKKHNLSSAKSTTPLFIQCFDQAELMRFAKEHKPERPLIQLIAENSWKLSETDYDKVLTAEGMRKVKSYAAGIGPWIPQVLGELRGAGKLPWKKGGFLEEAHRLDLDIHPYTFRSDALPKGFKNEKELLDKLFLAARVQGIFADQPDRVLSYLKRSPDVGRN